MWKSLKLILFLVFVVLLISGCAGLKSDYDAYLRSQQDAAFMASLNQTRQGVSSATSGMARSIPVTAPVADFIGWGAGAIVYLLASLYHGRSIKKRGVS